MPGGRIKFLKQPWALQRLELLSLGIEVPELGSSKDLILRGFLVRQANKRLASLKMSTYSALSMAGDNKDLVSTIQRAWRDYANIELFMESEDERRETDLREAFEFWRKVKPEAVKDKNGSVKSIKLKGLL